MDEKYGEFVGVKNLNVAIVTKDDETAYTAETPEYLAPAADVAGEPETDNTRQYYDNVPGINYVTEGVTVLTVTISGIPAEKAAKYTGKKYDETTGRIYDDGDPNPPDTALSFQFNKGKSGYRYYQYLKGVFTGGTEEAASKSNTVDIKTYQLTYTAINTTHQWNIDGENKSLKRIFGDTTDPAFDPAGWFNQVQTPDTATPPAALNLDTSDPLDEATGVAVDSNILLTFNNKVYSYSITLINASTLDVIAAAYSLDATGKILTINPDSNLGALTEYAVIVSSVTDVYGQKLSNIVINFTTAA